MTNEELDEARVQEGRRIVQKPYTLEHVARVVARLAREGWTPPEMVLVPREPTREMVAAGDFVLFEASQSDSTFGEDAIDTWRAMLSAAPKVTT